MLLYFELLVSIHSNIYQEYDFGVRPSFSQKQELNQILEQLYKKEYQTKEELLNDLLKCCAVIILLQPFYDGNHHTALEFIKYYLDSKNYTLDMAGIQKDYQNGNDVLPLIYSKEEKVPKECIKILTRNIKRKKD